MFNNSNTLSLRQIALDMAEYFQHNVDVSTGLYNSLASILLCASDIDDEHPRVHIEWDEINSFIDDNLSTHGFTLWNDGFKDNAVELMPINMTFENAVYTRPRSSTSVFSSIRDFVLEQGYSTITSYTGMPVMEWVYNKNHSNLLSAVQGTIEYNDTAISVDIAINYNEQKVKLCHLDVYKDEHEHFECYISEVNEHLLKFDGIVGNFFTAVKYSNEYSSLLYTISKQIADGNTTISDISGNIGNYLNSGFADIRNYARTLISNGSLKIEQALANLISFFRSRTNITEVDGKVVWDTNSSIILGATAGEILNGVMMGALRAVSTMLTASAWIVTRVVGGLVMAGINIYEQLTSSVASATGVAPYINDDALDYTYKYPMFALDKLVFDKSLFTDKFITDLEQYKNDTGRFKITTKWYVAYFYNIVINESTIGFDFKLFNTVRYCYNINDKDYTGDNDPAAGQTNSIQIHDNNDGYDSWCYITSIRPATNPVHKRTFAYVMPTIVRRKDYESYIKWIFSDKGSIFESVYDADSLTAPHANGETWHNVWNCLSSSMWMTLNVIMRSPVSDSISARGSATDELTFLKQMGFAESSVTGYDPYGMRAIYGWLVWYISTNRRDIEQATYDHYTAIVNSFGQFQKLSKPWMVISLLLAHGSVSMKRLRGSSYYPYGHYTKYNFTVTAGSGGYDDQSVSFGYQNALPNNSYSLLDMDWDELDDSEYGAWSNAIVLPQRSYVAPPLTSLKSVLWAIGITAGISAVVMTGITVAKAITRKATANRMRAKQLLLSEQGKTYDFTSEDLKQLSPEDRKEYSKSLNKYKFQVKLYNIAANFTGSPTYDWGNNWLEYPASTTSETTTDVVNSATNALNNLTSSEQIQDSISYMSNNVLTPKLQEITGVNPDTGIEEGYSIRDVVAILKPIDTPL